jgi:hypothetical protein
MRRAKKIAALYVQTGGVYFGLPDVDPWDQTRDARRYAGPYPVVAHPPCERWGRYWSGGPSARVRREKGDDAGCFEAALSAVRRFGGVLEHPADSHAWRAFGLFAPPVSGGWINADFEGGWTCRVEQGHFGHRARKATWLYAVGVELPKLPWGRSASSVRIDDGYHTAAERRAKQRKGVVALLSKRQRSVTPIAFRDCLLAIARSALVALLFVLVGCGAELADPFVGSWSGTVSQPAATCSDGSGAPASTSAVNLEIARTGPDALAVKAACGDLPFTVTANFALLDVATPCAPSNGITLRIDRAMLRLDGDALQLDYNVTAGTAGATCPLFFMGTLNRRGQ